MRWIILAIPPNNISVKVGFGIYLLGNVLLRFTGSTSV
jgi:hypothetical protein